MTSSLKTILILLDLNPGKTDISYCSHAGDSPQKKNKKKPQQMRELEEAQIKGISSLEKRAS